MTDDEVIGDPWPDNRYGPRKKEYKPFVYLIYRKLKGTYHESPWVLYRRHWTNTLPAAKELAERINEWDRAFIGAESKVQVRKFYYGELSKKTLAKYHPEYKSPTHGHKAPADLRRKR